MSTYHINVYRPSHHYVVIACLHVTICYCVVTFDCCLTPAHCYSTKLQLDYLTALQTWMLSDLVRGQLAMSQKIDSTVIIIHYLKTVITFPELGDVNLTKPTVTFSRKKIGL